MSDEYDGAGEALYTEADVRAAAELARAQASEVYRVALRVGALGGLSADVVLKALEPAPMPAAQPADDSEGEYTTDEIVAAALELADSDEHPAGALEALAEKLHVGKAWDESKHKRDHGKFSSTGGSGAGSDAKTAGGNKPGKRALKAQKRAEAVQAASALMAQRAKGKPLSHGEAKELLDHMAHLTHDDLRALRKEHGSTFRGERVKGSRVDALVKWARGEDYTRRRGKRGSALQQVVDYGGLDPNSADFKRFYGSMRDAVNDGVPMAAFKRGGQGLDELAAEMVAAGHISIPDWEDPAEHLVGLLRGRKLLHHAADEGHEGRYAEHVAGQLEGDDGSATFDPNKEWDDEDPDWFSKAAPLPDDDTHTPAELLAAAVDVAQRALADGTDPEDGLHALYELAHGDTVQKAWTEEQKKLHPRDKGGHFISKDAIAEAKTDPAKAKELRAKVKPEDAQKLDDAIDGKTDLGRTKRGQAKHEAAQKREKVQADRNRARELRIKLADQESRGEELNADDLREIVPHLATMTHEELSRMRAMLERSGATFGGKRLRAERVEALTQWALDKAAGKTDAPAPDVKPEAESGSGAGVPSDEDILHRALSSAGSRIEDTEHPRYQQIVQAAKRAQKEVLARIGAVSKRFRELMDPDGSLGIADSGASASYHIAQAVRGARAGNPLGSRGVIGDESGKLLPVARGMNAEKPTGAVSARARKLAANLGTPIIPLLVKGDNDEPKGWAFVQSPVEFPNGVEFANTIPAGVIDTGDMMFSIAALPKDYRNGMMMPFDSNLDFGTMQLARKYATPEPATGTAAAQGKPPKTRLQAQAERARAANPPPDPNAEFETPREQYQAFLRYAHPDDPAQKPDPGAVAEYLSKLPPGAREKLDQHFATAGKSLAQVEAFHRARMAEATPERLPPAQEQPAAVPQVSKQRESHPWELPVPKEGESRTDYVKRLDANNPRAQKRPVALTDADVEQLRSDVDQARRDFKPRDGSPPIKFKVRRNRNGSVVVTKDGGSWEASTLTPDESNYLRRFFRARGYVDATTANHFGPVDFASGTGFTLLKDPAGSHPLFEGEAEYRKQRNRGIPGTWQENVKPSETPKGDIPTGGVAGSVPEGAVPMAPTGNGLEWTAATGTTAAKPELVPGGAPKAPDVSALKRNPRADLDHIERLKGQYPEGAIEREWLDVAKGNAAGVATRDNSALAALHGGDKQHGARHYVLERLASAAAQAHKDGDAAGHTATTNAVTGLGGTLHGAAPGETIAHDPAMYDHPEGAFSGTPARVVRQPVTYRGALVYRGQVEPVGTGAQPPNGGGTAAGVAAKPAPNAAPVPAVAIGANPVSEPTTPVAAAAEPQPGDTPRAVAKRVTEAAKDDYAFARASAVGNAGEDLKGSARHTRNQWRGLEEAEKNGTAAALVTRDSLLKNEPHALSSTVEAPTSLAHLAAHLALSAFPAKPGEYSGGRFTNNFRTPSSPEELRKQYVEAYQAVKAEAERAAAEETDPKQVAKRIQKLTKNIIDKLRDGNGGDRYNPVANALVDLNKKTAVSMFPKATHVIGRVNDFAKRLKEKYPNASVSELLQHAHGHVADVLEGDSFNKTFGTVAGPARFDPSAAYVSNAERKGGRMIDAATVEAGKAHMMNNVGLRGLQWGNSVTDDERQHHLTKSAEAFADLADATGLPDSAISLGGKLGLAIGARGKGGARAHYEQGEQVINLTRAKGVGSLAHEWGHALDHFLTGFGADEKDGGLLSEKVHETIKTREGPIADAMQAVAQAMTASGFRKRLSAEISQHIRDGKLPATAHSYWANPKEMFARTFERFVQHKLHSEGRENTYLTGLHKVTHPLWPDAKEMETLAPAMDKLMGAIRDKHFTGTTAATDIDTGTRAANTTPTQAGGASVNATSGGGAEPPKVPPVASGAGDGVPKPLKGQSQSQSDYAEKVRNGHLQNIDKRLAELGDKGGKESEALRALRSVLSDSDSARFVLDVGLTGGGRPVGLNDMIAGLLAPLDEKRYATISPPSHQMIGFAAKRHGVKIPHLFTTEQARSIAGEWGDFG